MADEITTRIDGLREFRNELKDVAAEMPRELRSGLKDIVELMAPKVRSAFESGGGVLPKVAPSVKVLAQQTGASIRIGGTQYPFALGAEFGSAQFKQFQPWRGSGGDAGYALYPTVRAEREHLVDDVGDLMERLASKAFPN